MDIMDAPEETLRNVNEGMQQVMSLVADELMFIFFPEEYAQNNPDYWTFDDRSLLDGRSMASSYYTRDETISTLSNRGWKKVVGDRGPGKKNKGKREAREGSVASKTQTSDQRQDVSEVGGSDKIDENDVMNLFMSETEDVESPPEEERREDASLTNSQPRMEPEEIVDIRQISSGTSANAIDLCDAEEVDGVVVTSADGENEELAANLGESTLQRLQRLRAKREELRQERERYESGIPFNHEPQDDEPEDARPEPQGDYEVDEMNQRMNAIISRDLQHEPVHVQSEANIIDQQREQIQAKVQQLSKVLDQIMIKKLNGEFPDDPSTRAMEAEIRANLLEFQRWWQPSQSDNNIRIAPTPEFQRQW
ncbi:unnamed protein product [Cylindrotheca closterium]|uniref:Uncharacterized protein n=1 Tax=Cylindrotheca closterium TaxID=2856 RepID=A0AAD2FLZ8_9STRA|nr:unnamed protein product [Cylindrotheca closterium]